jgi:pimeloyl-ACP methyl ester carboxylesterase
VSGRLRVPIDVGHGAPIVVLHGFALRPATYRPLAELLAQRARVLVPDLFAVRGPWRYGRVLDAFTATLDHLGLDRVTMIGHSFGGGIELGFASHHPERVTELVFSDTLAVSQEWGLADEAARHPLGLLRLATAPAVAGFATSWLTHPRQLVDAAWWGFRSRRDADVARVAAAGIPAHVLWANRDSILTRSDGREFAERLRATFTVAAPDSGGPIDHDWMFQQPELFVADLDRLGLRALAPAGDDAGRR